MKRAAPFVFVFLVCVLTACNRPQGKVAVRVEADHPLDDQSTLAADLPSHHYRRLIVVPPAAREAKPVVVNTAPAEKEAAAKKGKAANPPRAPERPAPAVVASRIERELLHEGFTLLSPELAGRAHAGEGQSQVERLLALGAATGADAILEMTEFVWRDRVNALWYVYDKATGKMKETDPLTFSLEKNHSWYFHGPQLEFGARLLDVKTGAVKAVFEISCNDMWNLPGPYTEELSIYPHKLTFLSEPGYKLAGTDGAERKLCLSRVVHQLSVAIGLPSEAPHTPPAKSSE